MRSRNMTFFKSLPPNDLGHDFVVGDSPGDLPEEWRHKVLSEARPV